MVRPWSEIATVAPSRASGLGTQAIPITRSRTGENRALVTYPAGAPTASMITDPSVGT